MQLPIATLIGAATVLIHLADRSILVALMDRRPTGGARRAVMVRQGIAIMAAAFGLFAPHRTEIWAYACLQPQLGALSDFEQASYVSTYVTIGYGDVDLPVRWRLLGAIGGANGIMLLGWSTTFIVSIIDRIRLIEREIEEA